MTIAISISAILAQVYAQAALRHEINTPDSAILTTGSDRALRTLARSAASTVAMAMLPVLSDTDLGTADSDIIKFEVADGQEISLPALRLLAEQTIAASLLGEVYAATDSEASQSYIDQHTRLLARLRRAVRSVRPACLRPFP